MNTTPIIHVGIVISFIFPENAFIPIYDKISPIINHVPMSGKLIGLLYKNISRHSHIHAAIGFNLIKMSLYGAGTLVSIAKKIPDM